MLDIDQARTERPTRLRVAIVYGGQSAEHAISILSARNVLLALDRSRFDPMLIGITREGRWLLQSEPLLLKQTDAARAELQAGDTVQPLLLASGHAIASERGVDVVFPVVHGSRGEDGSLQGLLDVAGIPYVGAGVLGSAIGMDKDVSKRLLLEAGIPVAKFMVFRHHEFAHRARQVCAKAACMGFPLFVKPANLGSSVGVAKVTCRAQLPTALRDAFMYDTKVLVEAAIVGRELECAVLGGVQPAVSGVGEIIVRDDDFYSYRAKYLDEHGARLDIPARLGRAVAKRVQTMALRAFAALECFGMARVDFFLTDAGRLLVNEINTLPGFTAMSMYPKLWETAGVSVRELVSMLIDLAVERHTQRRALHITPPNFAA